VGTVSGPEGIVDVDFRCPQKLFGEIRIIFFLFDVEADIFEQEDFARLESGSCLVCNGTDTVAGKVDGALEKFGQMSRNRAKRVFFDRLSLWTA
jgi:hypothetical protein